MHDPMKITRTMYTISDFLAWQRGGQLDLRPPFQRGSVWNTRAKSYFIDTLLRGFAVPIIFLQDETTQGRTPFADWSSTGNSVFERFSLTSIRPAWTMLMKTTTSRYDGHRNPRTQGTQMPGRPPRAKASPWGLGPGVPVESLSYVSLHISAKAEPGHVRKATRRPTG